MKRCNVKLHPRSDPPSSAAPVSREGAALPRRVSFYTLGCRVNAYETQAMEERFRAAGFAVVPFGAPCDVCVVNTCAVTAESERKSAQLLRRAGGQAAHVIAVGCFAQLRPEKAAACSGVGYVGGCAGKPDAVAAALALCRGETPPAPVPACGGGYEPMSIFTRAGGESGKCRTFLKIQDGCSGRCTYCIIPSLRGPSRSRDAAEILDEAARAVRAGVKELVLTGIETGAYNRMPLGELAARVAAVPGVERIRLGSLDPACVTTALAARLSALPNFMPHFHLSLQSGSDSVLRRMRRPYDSAGAQRAIDRLRDAFPDLMLSADVISGFPGETEEEFAQTCAFIERNSFAHIHAFPFSPREGTPAAAMEGRLPPGEAKARNERLIALAERVRARVLCSRIGGTETVLLERTDGDCGSGHTAGFLECVVRGAGLRVGELTAVRVTGVENGILLAVSESL